MTNPFAQKRFELGGDHVYYLEAESFRELEDPLPTFLVGSRGTGKTTLLKALDWEERLHNRKLQEQLPGAPFAGRYLGLYFKLPLLHLELLETWLADASDWEYGQVFACYVDLCWLEALAPALRTLELRREIVLERGGIEQTLEFVLQSCRRSPLLNASMSPMPSTIHVMLDRLHDLRRVIEKSARRRVEVGDVLDALPVDSIGDLGRRLGRLCCSAILGSDRTGGWSLKICMDEGDALSLRQQRVINTMIRLAEYPVGYIVAYASRPSDVTTTYIPNQSLQIADRKIILRDEMSDAEFLRLAEGVVNVRLAPSSESVRFNIEELLGPLDLNELLVQIGRSSEGAVAADLLDSGKRLGSNSRGSPMIWEAFLQSRLGLAVPTSDRGARKQGSEQVRKKMVGAYLLICSLLRHRPLYASADMVLQLSDNCIRDFLRQMECIFFESGLPLDKFLEEKSLSSVVQNKGLAKAAEVKSSLLSERILNRPAEANQLVIGLAHLTRLLQIDQRNDAALRTPERGLFVFESGQSDDSLEDELLIREAAAAGYLRLYDINDNTPEDLVFRVHTSLAPRFGFSYRGAYYRTPLSQAAVRALREARTDNDLRRVAHHLSRGAPSDADALFDLEIEDESEF